MHGLHLLDSELLLLDLLLVLLEQDLELKLFLGLGWIRQKLLKTRLACLAPEVQIDQVLLSLALTLLDEKTDADVRTRLVQLLLL